MKRLLTFVLSVGFFIWLPNAFADGGGLSLDAPSSIRQTQGEGNALLTLTVDNIQVRAEWRVTDADSVFTIKAGMLQTVTTIVAPVIHVATIYAVDRFDLLNPSYANLTASAVITVKFESGEGDKLRLDDVPRLTAVAGKAVSLHTFTVEGGSDPNTYTLVGGNADYFDLDKDSGVLSLLASAQAGVYTLTVQVEDDNSSTVVALATVEVSAALMLSDAPLIPVALGAAVSLHKFIASGGIGIKTYTLLAGDESYFSVDAGSGVLSLLAAAQEGVHTVTVQAIDAGSRKVNALATVEVSAALMLSDAPLISVALGSALSLHKFIASGGIGIKTYTLLAGDESYFSVDAGSGVLSLLAAAQEGVHTVTVQAIDAGSRKINALATVRVSAALMLSDAPSFTVVAGVALILHKFIASGGIGIKTYTLLAGNKGYFSVNAGSGVLSLLAGAQEGVHTLTVQAIDEGSRKVEALATVRVSAALMLSDAPSFTVVAGVALRLHKFIASGGIGIKTYTLLAGNKGYFSVNAGSGVLSLLVAAQEGVHTVTVQAIDAGSRKVNALATVRVSAALMLADAPLISVALGATVGLHKFIASGGIGIKTYTLLAGDESYFSVDASSGVLSLLAGAQEGVHTVTVQAIDAGSRKVNALATVRVSAALMLLDAPSFTVIASVALSLHTFIASGGIGIKTYTLLAGNKGYFSVNATSGVLSLAADAEPDIYVVMIQAMDEHRNTAEAVATVEVSAALSLSDAQRLGGAAGQPSELHTFAAEGGIGARTYTLLASDAAGYFSLGAESGVLSLLASATVAMYTLSVRVKDGKGNMAQALATVEVRDLFLANAADPLYAIEGRAVSLHTFAAQSDTEDTYTYTLLAGDAVGYFSLGAESGVLSVLATSPIGIYTLSVQAEDSTGNQADAMALVEVRASLSLVAMPPLTIIVGRVAHTLTASGGIGTHTYTIVSGDDDGHFALGAASGVLSLRADAALGRHLFTVQVADARNNTVQAVVMVEVSAVLALADAPSFTVIASVAMSLHTFISSGGIGAPTYTIVADNNAGYFALNAASGVLSLQADAALGRHTLTVRVMDERGNTDQAVATVGVSAMLSLAEVSPLTIIVGDVAHTLVASGGIGVKTYTITEGDGGGYFALDVISGVLSLSVGAPAKMYTLTVRATDERNNIAEVVATVDVSAVLALAEVPSFTVIASVAMSLHTFIASGGIGVKTYTLVAGDDEGYFAVDAASGVFSLSVNAPVKEYMLTVQVMDERGNTTQAVVTVGVSAALSLAEVSPLTIIVGDVAHTLVASGGIGVKTYTITGGDGGGYFALDVISGVLSLSASAPAKMYTLTVRATDKRSNIAELVATVEVSAVLALAAAPSFTVIASVAMSLHTFIASGGIGSRTYTLLAGDEGYFSVGAGSGVLSLSVNAEAGRHTLTVQVMDARDNTAQAVVMVEVSAELALADAPLLHTIVGEGENLHTFAATGGIGDKTYTIVAGNDYFSLDPSSGVLSLAVSASVAMYTLSVQVADAEGNVATALATVEVVSSLLRDVMLYAIVGQKVSLHTFEAGGGSGEKVFTIVAGNEAQYFTIDAKSGVLSVQGGATVGIYTLSVAIDDDGGNREAEVMAVVAVEASLFLADAPLFTVFAVAMSVHTFAASGGIGAKTYTITAVGDGADDFILNATSGVLSVANATAGVYTLSVKVSDSRGNQAQARGTVEVVGVLSLSDAPSLEALARLSVEVSLTTFVASGGYGAKRYTLIAAETSYFALDADSGELSLPSNSAMLAGIYTLLVGVSDSLTPPQRATAVATVQIARNGIFVLGGNESQSSTNKLTNDVWWSVDGKSWRENTSNAGWTARELHQVVAYRGRMYLMGGFEPGPRKDVWSSMDGKNWSLVTGSAGWTARGNHQAVVHNGRMYVLGGNDGSLKNDVWSWAEGEENWLLVTVTAAWSARQGLQAVSHNGRLYVLGGWDANGNRNDVWSSADGANWRFEGNAKWTARWLYEAVSHNGRLYVLGGNDGGRRNDVWSSLDGRSWVEEQANNSPFWTKRGRHRALSRDGLLYVLGGNDNSLKKDVWSSPDGKSWSVETSAAGWGAREYHQVLAFPPDLALSGTSETITLTMQATVALHTVSAQYGFGQYTYSLPPEIEGFSIDGAGVLSADGDAQLRGGVYAITVRVDDEEGGHAETIINIELQVLALADAPPLSVIARAEAMSLHVFTAIYETGAPTYNLVDDSGYFTLGTESGVLSVTANVAAGVYTLSVVVRDGSGDQATAVATVEALPLSLADAPFLEVLARLSVAVTLHTFVAVDSIGSKRYTLLAGNGASYFALDADSGELSLPPNPAALAGVYTLRVQVSDDLMPPQRATAVATVHIIKSGIFVMGGKITGGSKNDVWLSLDSGWRKEANAAWGARDAHQAVAYKGRLWVMGGWSGGYKNDVWSSADGKSWSLETAGTWSGRTRHRSMAYKGRLYVTGGESGSLKQEVWSWAPGEASWTMTTPPWSARDRHQAVVHNGRLYVLGGNARENNANVRKNDVWSSADGANWRFEGNAGWRSRSLHQAVSHQGRLYVMGGWGGNSESRYNDVWSSVDGRSWREEKANNSDYWIRRTEFQAVSRDGLLYVMGGTIGRFHSGSGENGSKDVWTSADGKIWSLAGNAGWKEREGFQTVVFPPNLVLSGSSETITLTLHHAHAEVEIYPFSAQNGFGQYNYSLPTDTEGFKIDSGTGVLSAVKAQVSAGTYQVTVRVEDEDGSHAESIINIELQVLALADAPPLSVIARAEAMSLHVFTAIYETGAPTYNLVDDSGYFTLGTESGVLSVTANVAAGFYTLSVVVSDENNNQATAVATVEARALSLADAPPLAALARLSVMVSLHTFVAGDSIGSKRYTIIAAEAGYFVLDAVSGELSLPPNPAALVGVYTLRVEVSDDLMPPQRATAAATVQIARNGIFVLGGNESQSSTNKLTNDVWWSVDGGSWRENTSNAGWTAREFHQVVAYRGRMYLMGGVAAVTVNSTENKNDVWSSLDGKNWSLVTDSADWTARGHHQALVHKGRMYVLGGKDTQHRNDVWSSADGKKWSLVTGSADWSVALYRAVAHNGRMYVTGGYGRSDVWSSADGSSWRFEGNAAWGPRHFHQAVSHAGRLYVLGGIQGYNRRNDVWSSLDGRNWVREKADNNAFWAKRDRYQALSRDGLLYVLGGNTNGTNAGLSKDVWSSADGKSWTEETAAAGWGAREYHQALVFPPNLALSGTSETITLTVGVAAKLHPFSAQYGFGQYTYLLPTEIEGFKIDESSGVLSADNQVQAGVYTLTVRVDDEEGGHAETIINIELRVLALADVPPLFAVAGLAESVSLHAFTAIYGIGAPTYNLVDESGYFTLGTANGVLSVTANVAVGVYTVSVEVSDDSGKMATAVATVEAVPMLSLADAPLLSVVAGKALELHTFTAVGGSKAKTYNLVDAAGFFTLGESSGILSVQVVSEVGIYTVSVEVSDSVGNQATAQATVEVIARLSLADASLMAVEKKAVSLHTFVASGGIGARIYTLSVGNETGYFVLDAASGVLSLSASASAGEYTLTVGVKDERDNVATAVATVNISAGLSLAGAPQLFVIAEGEAKNLHTFVASGGLGVKTYTVAAGAGYFTIGTASGILSVDENATVGMYTLSVQVEDADGSVVQALATVEVVSSLLRDVMLYAIVGQKVSLHTFEADGGSGEKVFTIVAGNEAQYFTIDATSGVLSVQGGATVGIYTLSVAVDDDGGNREGEVMAVVAVEASLFLADVPLFTVFAVAMSVHTFAASGGIGAKTYTITAAGDGADSFSLNATSGVLSVANATAGVYTLSVKVSDSRGNQAQARGTVEVVEVLSLADVSLEALARLSVGVTLTTFAASGGYGAKRYTMIADESGYFAFDADSGELSLPQDPAMLAGEYTLFVVVSDSLVPPQRVTATVVVRIGKNGIFVIGGRDGGFPRDVWLSLDGKNWLKQSDNNAAWPGRYEHQVASHQGRLYLLGGGRQDVWSSADGSSWSSEGNQNWAGRYQFQVVEYKDRLYAMGGSKGGTRQNDVWSSADGEIWTRVTMNAAWPARQGHQVVVYNDRMYLLGGFTGGYRNDVWSSADGSSWSFEGNANWSGRSVHQAVSHQGRLYVLGGRISSDSSGVWSWAVGEENWNRETPNGWPARDNFQAVSYDGLLYVMGGQDPSNSNRNDVWSSADGKKWTIVTVHAGWSPRQSPQAVVFPPPLVMWGVGASEAIILTLGVSAAEIYAVTAQYGLGPYTYSLTPENMGIKIDGDGILSLDDDQAQAGAYAVTVRVEDKEKSHAEIIINIEIRSIALADAPPLSVFAGAEAMSLHVFTAIYGIGAPTYNLVDDLGYFTLGTASGVLSVTANVAGGVYTLSVVVSDENNNQATAVATVVAVPLSLADAPPLSVIAGAEAVSLHVFTAIYGVGASTYELVDDSGYFILGTASGVLSVTANVAGGVYTLSVVVSDGSGNQATAVATVEAVSLSLADAPSLEVFARLSLTVTLHTFAAGGGYGAKRYTVIAGNEAGYFALDAASGELSLPSNSAMLAGAYTLRVEVEVPGSMARATAAATVRIVKNRIFVLGGNDGQGSPYWKNDVWSSADGESWRRDKANNNVGWTRRQLHQAVAHNGRLYVMGGADGNKRNDVWWSVDGANWQRETDAAWTAREIYQAVSYNGRIYVLGGLNGGKRNDVWSSADGVTWDEETGSAGWTARDRHQAVVHNGRIWLLGGQVSGSGGRNDVWSSANGSSWRFEGNADWDARYFHQAVSHAGRLYVLGGASNGSTRYNDVWSSVDGRSWEQEKADNNVFWSKRYRHQSLSRDGLLYVLGGQDSVRKKDVWSSADGRSWTKRTDAAWTARLFHQALVFPPNLVLSGSSETITLTLQAAAVALHTLSAQYGGGQYTYSLASEVTGFDIDESSGVLSADGNAAVGGYTLTVQVEDEEGSQAETVVQVEIVAASTAALSAVERFAWGGSGSRNDVGLSEHGDNGRREGEGLRRFQQAMRYQG